jgi:predicted Zn-dependent peptidase
MEQHETPLIYIRTVIKTGSVNDGARSGLASFTADALMLGTEKYKKSDLEEAFEFIGAQVNTYAGREASRIDLSFLSKDLNTVLPLWFELATRPSFDEAEIVKYRQRLLVELQQDRESPRSVMNDYYNHFLYGNHPYGNPLRGAVSTVQALQPGDLRKFYDDWYLPQRAAIVVCGDFKTAEMKKTLQDLFRSWRKPGEAALPDLKDSLPELTDNRVLLVNKENSRETTFYIGGFGVNRNHPEYIAIQLVNTVLGGRFTSWLNDELRVNSGLTYGAVSRFVPYQASGIFFVSSFTATPTTVKAIDLALEVLNRLHQKGIDPETLTSAKNYMKGQFPPQYETAGQLSDFMAGMFIYGYDEQYINHFLETVENMTPEKTREVIARYFPKDKLQFVLIGKASEIREQVAKYGQVTEKEITADGF